MTRQQTPETTRQIVFAFLRAEYGDTVTDELIIDVIDNDLSPEQIDTIVATVEDQPHLIDHTPATCPALPALCDSCQEIDWLTAPTDDEWMTAYDAHTAEQAQALLARIKGM